MRTGIRRQTLLREKAWSFCDGGGYDDASATREPGDSSSSGEIVVDVAPRVAADLNTQEREQQMRYLARWKINIRHGKCAICDKARGPPGSRATGGDGRCRWCGSHVCTEGCFRKHDVKCDEHSPRDGGRIPEGVDEAVDPSHWRETRSTPTFRAFESLEVVALLKHRVEQCYDDNPAPDGSPLLLSRCDLAAMLHDCAEQVSRGRAGRLPAESFQPMAGEDRGPPTPPPPEYPTPWRAGGYGGWV